ncbi:unnamed protein product [Ectocarpus sp. 12 AP-2014]
MGSLSVKAAGVLVLIILALGAALVYTSGQRDLATLQAEHEQGRADILQQHQQWQRQQIRALNESLAKRDRTLSAIATDISASTAALEQLGERDAEARDWLDSGLPSGVADWVRELQQQTRTNAVRMPRSPGALNQ